MVGSKGSGKTKKLIDQINASAKTTPGNIVCIEKSMKLTYDIDHAARLIDVDAVSYTHLDVYKRQHKAITSCRYAGLMELPTK